MARLCVLAAVLVVVATVGCLLSTPALGANSSEFVKPMANASRQCKGNAIPHQSINALVQSMSLSLSLSLSVDRGGGCIGWLVGCEGTVALMASLLASNTTEQQIIQTLHALCRVPPPFFYQLVRAVLMHTCPSN
jgi:hypothetical protein